MLYLTIVALMVVVYSSAVILVKVVERYGWGWKVEMLFIIVMSFIIGKAAFNVAQAAGVL
jgi:hypothetical protein